MIEILLVLAIAGFLLWFLQTYVPMAPPFRVVINFVVVICLICWMLSFLGLIRPLPGLRIG